MNWNIKAVDPKHLTDDEYRAVNALNNRIRAERLPNDPPIPLEEDIQRLKNIPDFVQVTAWRVTHPNGALVASGSVAFFKMEQNQHVGEMSIEVLPEHRRHGIGRNLLAQIADAARGANRTLLIGSTNDRIPAGAAFMQRIGADKGLEGHTNQLDLKDLNRDLLRQWQVQAQERATDFELEFLQGPYPERDLADIARLMHVMNTAPRGSLQVEDFEMSPEHLRQQERSILARGSTRWSIFVREKSTGKFAGFTEMTWNPNRPQILSQMGTGVFPEYRNKGLGRWLKAAMLERVLRERPQVQFVRTGNADSNAAMLKINFELGFKHYISDAIWQVEVAKVFEYLGAKEMAQA